MAFAPITPANVFDSSERTDRWLGGFLGRTIQRSTTVLVVGAIVACLIVSAVL